MQVAESKPEPSSGRQGLVTSVSGSALGRVAVAVGERSFERIGMNLSKSGKIRRLRVRSGRIALEETHRRKRKPECMTSALCQASAMLAGTGAAARSHIAGQGCDPPDARVGLAPLANATGMLVSSSLVMLGQLFLRSLQSEFRRQDGPTLEPAPGCACLKLAHFPPLAIG